MKLSGFLISWAMPAVSWPRAKVWAPDAVSPPNIERAANSSSMWRML
jgi:hypothetical protein